MKKGEFWNVNLGEGKGSEQSGPRPCLIVQNDIGNKYSPTTIICPVTTKDKNFSATHLLIDCLSRPSYIMFEQIRVVDKSRLVNYICTIDDETQREVNKKLRVSLGL